MLREAHIRPAKSLGQHFLTDSRVLTRIAAAVNREPYETVVEVGPGLGDLTRRLSEVGSRVIAVELDTSLALRLRELAWPNVEVADGDALEFHPDAHPDVAGQDYVLAGNLPYNSGLAIVRHFLEAAHPPKAAVVMLQKEVVDGVVAGPGSMSLAGIGVQVFAEARRLFDVAPDAFYPRPKVRSSVMHLRLRGEPLVPMAEQAVFFRTVRGGFNAPRKQVRNSLAQGLGLAAQAVDLALAQTGVSPSMRPAMLSIQEWLDLSRELPSPMSIALLAPAKINLTLEVLGRREDGYHEVATLMQAVSLFDRLTIRRARTVELEVRGDAASGVPGNGPANLAYRAAYALIEAARDPSLGAHISLDKGIPASAGLGGGSSDAAAVLRGLNRFWALGLPDTKLAGLAAGLGSDVPFFLTGGAAECRGRGELVQPLDDAPARDVTLFVVDFEIPDKTRRMYSYVTPADYSAGRSTRVACNTYRRRIPLGDTDLINVFDRYLAAAAPPAGRAMALCRRAGLSVHAAGSGPCFYALLAPDEVPGPLRQSLAGLGVTMIGCKTLSRAECLDLQGD